MKVSWGAGTQRLKPESRASAWPNASGAAAAARTMGLAARPLRERGCFQIRLIASKEHVLVCQLFNFFFFSNWSDCAQSLISVPRQAIPVCTLLHAIITCPSLSSSSVLSVLSMKRTRSVHVSSPWLRGPLPTRLTSVLAPMRAEAAGSLESGSKPVLAFA